MSASRAQKRWAPRLRMAGALLVLLGTVALVDRLLPGVQNMSAGAQVALGAGAIIVGFLFFAIGRRWR